MTRQNPAARQGRVQHASETTDRWEVQARIATTHDCSTGTSGASVHPQGARCRPAPSPLSPRRAYPRRQVSLLPPPPPRSSGMRTPCCRLRTPPAKRPP